MNSPTFDAPDWHQATTLTERLALYHLRPSTSAPVTGGPSSPRAELWRAQVPFADASLFSQRLASDGLEEQEWMRLVAEPATVVQERAGDVPAFVGELVAAYTRPPGIAVDDILPSSESLNRRIRGAAGFLVAIEPLLQQARARLRAGLQELIASASVVPFDPAVVERLWLLDLPGELLGRMDRTFALELHVAKMLDLLEGDTPAERFASFVARLRDPEVVLAIFREYPVLAKNLLVCVEHWVAFGLEFFAHLLADWARLRETFSPGVDPGHVVALELGAGDPHRQGRSVLMLRLSSGLRLIYKPKALAVDVHFQELLGWLNTRGLEPPLRTITVVDRGRYGWIEVVEPAPCRDVEAVHRFFRRQGALVLLAYMLGATDFHYENLLAVGEHPVLIDLETLFHPFARTADVEGLSAANCFHRSVLRAGLLPRWSGGGPGLTGIDISGLGTKPGQQLSIGTPTYTGIGTDDLQFTREIVELSRGHNRANLDGADVDVCDYIEDVAEGFTAAYRLVLAHREELLAAGGPIARFAHDEVRVLMRNTQRYAFLRYDANHPTALRDALDRDRALDKLWIEVSEAPLLAKLIPSEREDLYCGDIPMFFTTPSETTVRDSRGRAIEGMFEDASLDQVVDVIRDFGEEDLARQLWYLRTSLTSLASHKSRPRMQGSHHAGAPARPEPAPVDRGRALATAGRMGERLASLAFADEQPIFLGIMPDGNRGWSFAPVDANLYHGGTGIALFFAYLGAVSKDARMTALARATMGAAVQHMERHREAITDIGVFEGCGSLLYAATHLGVLWQDAELLARAQATAARVAELVARDDRLDVIGGAAGTLVALLGLHAVAPSEPVMRAALACGEHLLARARPVGDGLAWPGSQDVFAPLTGFAHGSAGFAWALDALAQATGQERFAAAARRALVYERGTFVPGRGWPDWRKLEGASASRPSFEAAWCHGASGIGLGRLPWVARGDEQARAEVLTAIELVLQHPVAPDQCLCHGDVGNIEFFLEVARVLEQPELRLEAETRTAALLDSLDRATPVCGLPLPAEVPGLMAGVAGIGYGLLRVVEPRVPSVLLLAPPPSQPL